MKDEFKKIARLADLLGWKETMLGWGTWKGPHATTYAPSEWNPWFRAGDLAQVFERVPVAEIILKLTDKTEVFDLMDMTTIAKLVVDYPAKFADEALSILESEKSQNTTEEGE